MNTPDALSRRGSVQFDDSDDFQVVGGATDVNTSSANNITTHYPTLSPSARSSPAHFASIESPTNRRPIRGSLEHETVDFSGLIDRQRQQIANLQQQLSQVELERDELHRSLQAQRQRSEEDRQLIVQMERDFLSVEEQVEDSLRRRQELQARIVFLETQIDADSTKVSSYQQVVDQLADVQTDLDSERERYLRLKERASDQLRQAQEEWSKLQQQCYQAETSLNETQRLLEVEKSKTVRLVESVHPSSLLNCS